MPTSAKAAWTKGKVSKRIPPILHSSFFTHHGKCYSALFGHKQVCQVQKKQLWWCHNDVIWVISAWTWRLLVYNKKTMLEKTSVEFQKCGHLLGKESLVHFILNREVRISMFPIGNFNWNTAWSWISNSEPRPQNPRWTLHTSTVWKL